MGRPCLWHEVQQRRGTSRDWLFPPDAALRFTDSESHGPVVAIPLLYPGARRWQAKSAAKSLYVPGVAVSSAISKQWATKPMFDWRHVSCASPLRSRDQSEYSVAPTIVFSVLYWSFVISHDRGRIMYFNITMRLTSIWTMHRLREIFPFESAPRFLIFDRDAKCGLVKRIEERHRWVCYSVFWEQFPSAC